MAVMINEEKNRTKAREVNEMIERLTSIDWYSQAGVIEDTAADYVHQFMKALGVTEYELKWLAKEQVPSIVPSLSFSDSVFWDVVKEVPDQLKAKIDQQDQQALLEKTVEIVPEAVFHGAFKKAFSTFEDEKTIQYLIGHAMYISVMACSAVLADEFSAFEPIVQLLEAGHLPLGPQGNNFYLL
ncbi:hypothetical protein [Domibacillus epiphyticus]|uniref:Uncharacterized protein n=1 Tax=Domibacillus epiphyticus TaxID=1714355 RepID=A0A1V2A4W9_9BACI|nr:hypothetical protein [Domibacillus epiphyticus]OMP66006.1 hypothetical protein BTO28_14545 [Domibacillus epiphyticus]